MAHLNKPIQGGATSHMGKGRPSKGETTVARLHEQYVSGPKAQISQRSFPEMLSLEKALESVAGDIASAGAAAKQQFAALDRLVSAYKRGLDASRAEAEERESKATEAIPARIDTSHLESKRDRHSRASLGTVMNRVPVENRKKEISHDEQDRLLKLLASRPYGPKFAEAQETVKNGVRNFFKSEGEPSTKQSFEKAQKELLGKLEGVGRSVEQDGALSVEERSDISGMLGEMGQIISFFRWE